MCRPQAAPFGLFPQKCTADRGRRFSLEKCCECYRSSQAEAHAVCTGRRAHLRGEKRLQATYLEDPK
ncbi:unnamed protein product [Rangifer tarandus platyrhynchus]|uniref:Uncharacterized protein n=2 Tax=Rangifer tarandus platyrhynchus TaxID=3082113 RepID=A0ABN8ZMK3_RANTA|nr:unnamed protein product [Rangifer tarandus platyrhynchus]CAI9706734.1 unnamed protein product [Rangifer tarandus platyrhynchus]